MRKLLRNAALAALAALGMATAVPAAHAEGIYFGLSEGGATFGITTVENRHWRDRDRHEWRGRHGWDHRRGDGRRDGWRRGPPRCSPGEALAKAERLGLRRVWLRDVDRGTIRVAGRRHGERRVVTFARAPRCPVIGL